MANEFKHVTVGTEITQAEYEGTAGHVFNSQATGDIMYASSSSQLTRLGIGSTGAVLTVTGGVPAWDTTWTPTGHLIPATDDSYDLGSASAAWQDLFLEGDITLTDAGTIATSAGALTITSAAAATWSTSAGALTVTSGAALNLNPTAGSAIVLDGTINVDAGVVTGATSITSTAFAGDLTGDVTGAADTATLATNITATANNSTDETVYPTFVDGATGTQGIETDTGLTYNPSTGVLTSTTFTGALSGNATTSTEATNITTSANNSTDETVYPTFVDGATGTQGIETDTGLTYNPSSGILTSTNFTGALTGTADVATVATTVTITDNESTSETNAVIFTAGGDVDGGNLGLESDGDFTYNPSNGTVAATTFSGALSGNATTATALASGRTIAMTGDVAWTSASFDGSGNVTGAGTIQANAVEGSMLNNNTISGQTEITSGLAAADELLYDDGGVIKKVGLDTLTSYLAGVNAGTVTSTGLSDSSGVLTVDIQNMTASSTIVDADLIVIDDGADGTLRKMTRANFIESAALDAINIDGGAIDGVTLGTNSAVTQAVIDNININGTTIGHTGDTDLLTLTSANLAVAGDVEVSGSVEVATIDYTDGDNAIEIADGGGVTFAQDTTFSGIIDITDATDSSDATGDTGALRTEGGASIAKKLYVGTDLDVDGTAELDNITIAGAQGSDGQVLTSTGSGVGWEAAGGGGITHASTWLMTGDYDPGSDGTITANLSEVTAAAGRWGQIGASMTVSSGIFTFPTTGIWMVTWGISIYGSGNDTVALFVLQTSNDGFSSDSNDTSRILLAKSANEEVSGYTSVIMDVTNTSNDKVRFNQQSVAANITIAGAANNNTWFEFVRLGDT